MVYSNSSYTSLLEDLFVRNPITAFNHATGRRIEALDRPEIEKLLKLSAKSNHRMRDLLQRHRF